MTAIDVAAVTIAIVVVAGSDDTAATAAITVTESDRRRHRYHCAGGARPASHERVRQRSRIVDDEL